MEENKRPVLTFGYCRVSTEDQNLDRQIYQMREYGIPEDRIIVEKQSGRDRKAGYEVVREKLDYLFSDCLRSGDTLVISSIARLSREHLAYLLLYERIKEMKVTLVILNMPLDLTTPEGKLFMGITACFSQYEVDRISYVTKKGLDRARDRGVQLGRKKGPTIPVKDFLAFFNSFDDPHEGIQASMKHFEKTQTTIKRWLDNAGVKIPRKKRIY